jgi:hypothetical protein
LVRTAESEVAGSGADPWLLRMGLIRSYISLASILRYFKRLLSQLAEFSRVSWPFKHHDRSGRLLVVPEYDPSPPIIDSSPVWCSG